MRTCLAIAIVAIGATAHADTDLQRFTAAVAAHDDKAVARMFGDRVSFNGMWFADRSCSTKFSDTRAVTGPELGELARCVAKVEFTAGARKTTTAAILVEKPGIEIVVEIIAGKITLIGYVVAGATPTVAPAILERDRVAGSPRLAAKDGTWAVVCIDEHGVAERSTNIDYRVVDLDSGKAIANWRFRPFKVAGKPIPVATVVWTGTGAAPAIPTRTLAHLCDPNGVDDGVEGGVEGGVVGGVEGGVEGGPGNVPPPPPPPPPPGKSPQVIAPTVLEGYRIAGNKMIVPDDTTKLDIAKAGKTKIVGSFKLCVDAAGAITSVNQLKSTGFQAYDTKIQTGIRQWRYKPFMVNGQPVPVCTAVTFIYSQALPDPPKP
jgi:hypothetical protein